MMRRRGIAYLVAFAAAALGAGLGRAVVTTYLPYLLNRIDDAPGLIGTVMLVNAAAGFAVPLVVGLWSDNLKRRRRGRRLPFIAGGAVVTAGGLVAIGLGSGTGYLALALAGAVAYIGLNAVTTAHRALIPECFEDRERARATSAQEVLMLAGAMAGVAAGGSLAELAPWAPFALAAAAVPVLALPTLLSVTEPRATVATRSGSRPLRYYLRAARTPGVGALLSAQILWVLGYAAMPAFFILYADQVLNLTPGPASLMLAGFGVVTALAMLAAGRVREPGSYQTVLAMGVVLMGAGFLAISSSVRLSVVMPAFALAAIGFGLVTTIGFPLYSRLIPAGESGGYTAMFFSVRAISSAVALPAAGWAVAMTGDYRTLFAAGGVATLAALIPLGRLCFANGRFRTPERVRVSFPDREWVRRWGVALGLVFSGILVAALALAHTPLHWLDEQSFLAVNSLGPVPQVLYEVFDPHTRNYVALALVAAAGAALAAPRKVGVVLTALLAADLVAGGIMEAVYQLHNRPRPEEVLDGSTFVLMKSWAPIESFPSGHMIVTTALAATTAMALPWLRGPLWGYVAIVGVTRIMFGAHFPSDVLAGVLVGYVVSRAAFSLFVQIGALPAEGLSLDWGRHRPRRALERTA